MYNLYSRVILLNLMYSGPEVIKCTICTVVSFCWVWCVHTAHHTNLLDIMGGGLFNYFGNFQHYVWICFYLRIWENFVILTSIRGKHMHSVVRNIKKIKVLKLAILDSGCLFKIFYVLYCYCTLTLISRSWIYSPGPCF